jgi:hypothetical protein
MKNAEILMIKRAVLDLFRRGETARGRIERLVDQIFDRSINNPQIWKISPNKLEPDIERTTEAALQRALLFDKHSVLAYENNDVDVSWNDMELPVIYTSSPRKRCVDLIGFSGQDNRPVICELKFETGGVNTIVEGIVEILFYSEWLRVNAEEHQKNSIKHLGPYIRPINWLDFRDISQVHLVLAAGRIFWSRARTDTNRFKQVFDLREIISRSLNRRIHFFSIEISKGHFTEQKAGRAKFRPRMPRDSLGTKWKEIL